MSLSQERFEECNRAVDEIARKLRATRNGDTTAQDLIEAVELHFQNMGWNFQEFCYYVMGNQPAKVK